MYFEKLTEKSGKKIKEIFPNLQLIVTGGVNYEPYREKMNSLLGGTVDIVQTFRHQRDSLHIRIIIKKTDFFY
jgi:hypothetical protein